MPSQENTIILLKGGEILHWLGSMKYSIIGITDARVVRDVLHQQRITGIVVVAVCGLAKGLQGFRVQGPGIY